MRTCMAAEPEAQLLQSSAPFDIAVVEPRRSASGASVKPDFARLVEQTCCFVEVRQVIRIDPNRREHEPAAQDGGRIGSPAYFARGIDERRKPQPSQACPRSV